MLWSGTGHAARLTLVPFVGHKACMRAVQWVQIRGQLSPLHSDRDGPAAPFCGWGCVSHSLHTQVIAPWGPGQMWASPVGLSTLVGPHLSLLMPGFSSREQSFRWASHLGMPSMPRAFAISLFLAPVASLLCVSSAMLLKIGFYILSPRCCCQECCSVCHTGHTVENRAVPIVFCLQLSSGIQLLFSSCYLCSLIACFPADLSGRRHSQPLALGITVCRTELS